jgi:predicted DCC family thiol-disulfide oxidoreductase YuxK
MEPGAKIQCFYDAGCPLCRSFAGLLSKHLAGQIEMLPMGEEEAKTAKEFKLVTEEGLTLYGERAVNHMARFYPKVRDFFWMLPASYQGKAAVEAYRFGKWLRRLWGRGCRECS